MAGLRNQAESAGQGLIWVAKQYLTSSVTLEEFAKRAIAKILENPFEKFSKLT